MKTLLPSLKKGAKAAFAAVMAFATGLYGALAAGEGLGQLDAKTWLGIVILGLGAGAGTYGIKNS